MGTLYCTQATLVKHGDNYNAARILYCRSWQCEICRPRRQRELIAQAIKGKAERFITLTSSEATAENPIERCKVLIRAWRQIREEIACNMALPEDQRFALPVDERWHDIYKRLRQLRRDPEIMRRNAVEFLAVVEAQGNGNPHLHIIARGSYVPQRWLSWRMSALARAPICDIRYVKDRRKLANYVAKYCGKDPQRFGTCKRYWQSKGWALEPKIEKTPWRIGDPILTRSKVSIEDFEHAEHCYARKVFYDGHWLVSAHWSEPMFEDRSCEHAGCQHRHHGATRAHAPAALRALKARSPLDEQ